MNRRSRGKGPTAAERRRSLDSFVLTDADQPPTPDSMQPIAQQRERVINEALQNILDRRHVNSGILRAITAQGLVLAAGDGTHTLSVSGLQRLSDSQFTGGESRAHPPASAT